MKAISLFSGAGGLDLGLRQAGINTVASVEVDLNCANTLAHNFKSKILCADIRCLIPGAVAESTGVTEVDILHGGPPCQPFSQIGKREGFEHPDGGLILEYLKWVNDLRPKYFVIEQVKGFLNKEYAYNLFLARAQRFGYRVQKEVVNTLDFGVPQARQRLILIGSLAGFKPIEIVGKSKQKTVRDAISDLKQPTKEANDNHIDVTPARDRERISYVAEGEWLSKSKAPKSTQKHNPKS